MEKGKKKRGLAIWLVDPFFVEIGDCNLLSFQTRFLRSFLASVSFLLLALLSLADTAC